MLTCLFFNKIWSNALKPFFYKVGIIGGSGLDDPNILENQREVSVTTPFGAPSDALLEGTICGVPCVLLPRCETLSFVKILPNNSS